MKLCVFDLEGDGLTPSKIHCLTAAVYSQNEWRLKTTTNYDEMRSFFKGVDIIVGHNIMRWDIPVVERLLNIKVECKIVDTLALSWYLNPKKLRHGLDDWGKEFGVPKPKIDDWENQTIEEYIHRCQEDVRINCKLWDQQLKNLINLYQDSEKAWRFVDYLMFKIDCARAAEKSGWKLDVSRCEESLTRLELEKGERIEELKKAMPKTLIKAYKKKPKNLYRADGSLSVSGASWVKLLEEEGLPPDHIEDVEYVKGFREPNPNSTPQVKEWLFGLGWEPETFNYVNDKDASGRRTTRKVEQIRVDKKGEKVLCPSVVKLVEQEPAIESLSGLTVLSHRIGILKGYLKNVNDSGYLQARISGLTNTLRFKHSVIVNLPAASKPYGDIVRGVLIAPEGYELCGSDMSSLEDRTKQHYMWKHDPDYVKEMQTEDFDPHLALAEFAGALTPEQVKAHKNGEESHGSIRHLYKTANYSCTYGAGGAKLALTLNIPVGEGKSIVDAYRSKNWSIDAISKEVKTKNCLGQMWLYNPVSKFWYSLRHEKDKFSTLNQSTGVYCFDIWIYNFRKIRPQITGQMHDEVILCVPEGKREEIKKLLKDSIVKTNKQLKLNRELDVDVQFGDNYAKIH